MRSETNTEVTDTVQWNVWREVLLLSSRVDYCIESPLLKSAPGTIYHIASIVATRGPVWTERDLTALRVTQSEKSTNQTGSLHPLHGNSRWSQEIVVRLWSVLMSGLQPCDNFNENRWNQSIIFAILQKSPASSREWIMEWIRKWNYEENRR